MKRKFVSLLLSVIMLMNIFPITYVHSAVSSYGNTFIRSQTSESYQENPIYYINVNGHELSLQCTQDYGSVGTLYADGKYIDDNVLWNYFSDGNYVYYEKKDKIVRADIKTAEKETIIIDEYGFIMGIYNDKYLYYGSSKYSDITYSLQDLIIYDIENKKEITYVADVGTFALTDYKIYTEPCSGDICDSPITEMNLDGSQPNIIADDAGGIMTVINNQLYYSALDMSEGYYGLKEQVRKYDSNKGITENLTEYNNGYITDINSEYAVFETFDGKQNIVYYKKEIKILLNGKEIEFDQPPINTPENRLLVPIRKIAESMNKTVLYSNETRTAFIDNSSNALIIPLYEKTMYLADENGFDLWGKVALDVPAMEINGRTLVPIRAFCESLGAVVDWNNETNTASIMYDSSAENRRMNDSLFDSINLVWYIEKLDSMGASQQFPFDDYSAVIDDFYENRPYFADSVNMGLSDPFAGIQDLVSMTDGSDNATNIILQSLQEVLSEVPSGNTTEFDAGIIKLLKDIVASGVDIYSEVGGLGHEIRAYSDALATLDDALMDYSKNYHSTVSGIFDLSVFSVEELAYLLTEYQTNIEYLDVLEDCFKEAGYTDKTIENSISRLRTQYTDKFIGVMLDLREACVGTSVSAVLTAGLTIAGESAWGVSVGVWGWKLTFGLLGINKRGSALKNFYGIYCIDSKLNSAFNHAVNNSSLSAPADIVRLKRLIELLKAEKTAAYKAMRDINRDKDSKTEADIQIENISKFSNRTFK